MSQHSQRTQDGPTTRSIVIGALMVAGSMAGTLYVIGGPGINDRELVASLMGAALIGFTVAHTMGLMVERAVVRDRAERAAEREQRERTERARIEAELETLRAERAMVPDRYADAPPLAPPMYPEERYEEPRYEDPVDRSVTRYPDEELDPLGYQADPERPWRAVEPDRVAVPLPPREVPVSPGRGWHGDETEVIPRVRDEDQTQVIPAQS